MQCIRKNMVKFKSLKALMYRTNLLKGDLNRWNIKVEQILKSLKFEFYMQIKHENVVKNLYNQLIKSENNVFKS